MRRTMKACIYCSCTDDNACMTEDGPCAWICDEPPVCSAEPCLTKARAEAMRIAGAGDCIHQPLWTSPMRCHCVRCGADLAEQEAA